MNITALYRARIKEIDKDDVIIPYRNLNDMKFGTLEIHDIPEGFEVRGIDKKNSNRIKFAKVVRNKEKRTDYWKPWRHLD